MKFKFVNIVIKVAYLLIDVHNISADKGFNLIYLPLKDHSGAVYMEPGRDKIAGRDKKRESFLLRLHGIAGTSITVTNTIHFIKMSRVEVFI